MNEIDWKSEAGLEVVDGAEAGGWIAAAIGGEFGSVSLQVPQVFDAYARIFHPATDVDGNKVAWGEVAERLGRTAHREMQWHQLVGTTDTFGIEGSDWTGSTPSLGSLDLEELDHLCAVLEKHSADPEHCYFGLCLINSQLGRNLEGGSSGQPLLKLPLGRDHAVLAGPLSAVDRLVDTDTSNVMFAYYVEPGTAPPAEPPEPDFDDPFWREAPHLIWPADRSWIVVSEVDFDSTLVGGSRKLIEALVAHPALEVYEVEPDTSLAAFADKVNLVPEPND
jgi:hypothetical protein